MVQQHFISNEYHVHIFIQVENGFYRKLLIILRQSPPCGNK